jgi:hypothetical protein
VNVPFPKAFQEKSVRKCPQSSAIPKRTKTKVAILFPTSYPRLCSSAATVWEISAKDIPRELATGLRAASFKAAASSGALSWREIDNDNV